MTESTVQNSGMGYQFEDAIGRAEADWYCNEDTRPLRRAIAEDVWPLVSDWLLKPRPAQQRIAVICGSTSQRDQMTALNRNLTLAGRIVLAPGVFQHDGDEVSEAQKYALDKLHFAKIDLAAEVHVIEKPDGSLGESTQREVAYADSLGKLIVNHPATDG